MREIKFRAFQPSSSYSRKPGMYVVKDMVFYDKPDENGAGEVFIGDGSAYFNEVYIMQYTGLKDKNGKEIYEGDVVKITYQSGYEENRIVMYDEDRYATYDIELWEKDGSLKNETSLGISSITYEVIGNIYETPELLEREYKDD